MTGFGYSDEEETYHNLENWLKERRDEYGERVDLQAWTALDVLLGEVRDAGAEGYLPWQR